MSALSVCRHYLSELYAVVLRQIVGHELFAALAFEIRVRKAASAEYLSEGVHIVRFYARIIAMHNKVKVLSVY